MSEPPLYLQANLPTVKRRATARAAEATSALAAGTATVAIAEGEWLALEKQLTIAKPIAAVLAVSAAEFLKQPCEYLVPGRRGIFGDYRPAFPKTHKEYEGFDKIPLFRAARVTSDMINKGSKTDKAAQEFAQRNGHYYDAAGHLHSQSLGGRGGLEEEENFTFPNIVPQNAGVNTSEGGGNERRLVARLRNSN